MKLSAQRLREVLDFDEQSGAFTWKLRLAHRIQIGDVAGYLEKKPKKDSRTRYMHIGIDGELYPAHRLAWLYVHGTWPVGQIDHLNGDGADNRIANLRDCQPQVNCENRRRARADSATGLLGAFKNSLGRPGFHSKIKLNGKQVVLGTFGTAEAAHEAFVAAKRQHHEGCTL